MFISKERFLSHPKRQHNNNNSANNNVNNRVSLCLRVLIYCLILDHQAIMMSNANSVNHRHKNHHNHHRQNHHHHHQLSQNNQTQNQAQNQHQNGRVKEIFLVKKNAEHILHWNGEMESSCSFISTIKELENSKECHNNNNNNNNGNAHSHPQGYKKNSDEDDDDDDFFKDSEEKIIDNNKTRSVKKSKRNVEESLSTILGEKVPVNTDGMWIPCGPRESCSVVYQVEKGWKIKQLFISGVVDRKAEIFVLAQYLTEKGKNYQLRRLHHEHGMNAIHHKHGHQHNHNKNHHHHPHPHHHQNRTKTKKNQDGDVDYFNDGDAPQHLNNVEETEFKRKEFSFFHEGFLDVSTLNVTAVLNGGFSLIDNITLILEKDYDLLDLVAQPPEPEVTHKAKSVILDVKQDEAEPEWIEITCNYRDLYEEFGYYGCPVSSGIKYEPENLGFWSPCHKTSCSFFYDGSSHNGPQSIVVDGYFHGANVSVYGKSHPLDDHFQLIDSRHFHNSTVLEIFFDLSNVCNVSVLQILVSSIDSSSDSTILIDKINVQHKPTFKSQTSSNQITGVGKKIIPAMQSRNSFNSGSGSIGKNGNIILGVFLHVSCNLILFVFVAKLFDI